MCVPGSLQRCWSELGHVYSSIPLRRNPQRIESVAGGGTLMGWSDLFVRPIPSNRDTDPRHWKFLFLYYNPDNPRLLGRRLRPRLAATAAASCLGVRRFHRTRHFVCFGKII